MATDLTRIGEKARKEPSLVFTTLYHHITDVDNLRACYDSLPAHKASGVNGVTPTWLRPISDRILRRSVMRGRSRFCGTALGTSG